jgi:aldose sugar dehydrogenase
MLDSDGGIRMNTLDMTAPARRILGVAAMALALTLGPSTAADEGFAIDIVVDGLAHPWGLAFLPGDGRLLVTERPGGMRLVDVASGEAEPIAGLPQVDSRGQGGLLDVATHPDFAGNGLIYLSWAGADGQRRTATHVGRARLDLDAMELRDLEVLHVAEPFVNSTGHYGSRIAFDAQNRFYVSTGDRQSKEFGPDHFSQDLSHYLGKILRFNDDGTIPADNPFVGDAAARDAIFTYGHRNPQGMAIHPGTGEVWANEHGENNGDEINVLQAGGNYGWPIATYGVDYRTGQRFAPTPPENPDTVDPVYWWEADHPEGFPPSGFAFYGGDAFPGWQGLAFIGNLRHQYLGVFSIDGHEVEQVGRLLEGRGWRIRDVAEGPEDGHLYLIVDDSSAPLVRLRPE